jgi:hypothetical protein
VAFKTNIIIKHHITVRDKTIDVFNMSGAYLMECKDGPPTYVEQDTTHSLPDSWSEALLEKMLIVQLLKKFPAFYATRRSITVFTRAIQWSLS